MEKLEKKLKTTNLNVASWSYESHMAQKICSTSARAILHKWQSASVFDVAFHDKITRQMWLTEVVIPLCLHCRSWRHNYSVKSFNTLYRNVKKKERATESTSAACGHQSIQTARQHQGGFHSVVTMNPQAERLTALIFCWITQQEDDGGA